MTVEPHPFDQAMALQPIAAGRWRARTSDDYWNMVGPFGGTIAALMLKSAMDHDERQGDPVALTVNFCAPVTKGDMEIEARPVRTNRSTQHFTCAIVQGGETVATATALFGARPETFGLQVEPMPEVPPFEQLERYPSVGLGWTERYDIRFAEGALDFGAAPGPTRSIIRVADDPPRPLDYPALAALCDVFFGRIIHVRRLRVPFGTVTMTAFLHATQDDLASQGSAPVLGRCDARTFERGFHDQSTELWGADGRLLATAHQLVYYRDPR